MELNNKEIYENVISLLKGGLEIYAEENNYEKNSNGKSTIELDKGETARFTLNQIQEILDNIQTMDDDYEEMIKNAESNYNQQKIINDLKDIVNG